MTNNYWVQTGAAMMGCGVPEVGLSGGPGQPAHRTDEHRRRNAAPGTRVGRCALAGHEPDGERQRRRREPPRKPARPAPRRRRLTWEGGSAAGACAGWRWPRFFTPTRGDGRCGNPTRRRTVGRTRSRLRSRRARFPTTPRLGEGPVRVAPPRSRRRSPAGCRPRRAAAVCRRDPGRHAARARRRRLPVTVTAPTTPIPGPVASVSTVTKGEQLLVNQSGAQQIGLVRRCRGGHHLFIPFCYRLLFRRRPLGFSTRIRDGSDVANNSRSRFSDLPQ